MRASKVTVVGSVNLDLVAHCERLPRPGETLTAATFARVPGGKSANQALAAARLGANARVSGRTSTSLAPTRSSASWRSRPRPSSRRPGRRPACSA